MKRRTVKKSQFFEDGKKLAMFLGLMMLLLLILAIIFGGCSPPFKARRGEDVMTVRDSTGTVVLSSTRIAVDTKQLPVGRYSVTVSRTDTLLVSRRK